MQNDSQPAARWQSRDVLVGVVRGELQREQNLAHRFYHIPAKLLAGSPEGIHYVALYQSRRLFGETSSGVSVYGAVQRFRLLPRREITEIPARRNREEEYCRFDIAQWQTLERPIRAGGVAPGVCMRTNLFLLENGRLFPELYLRTELQYRLYSRLRAASARTIRSGGSELLPARRGNTVMIAGSTIGIYTPEGRYEQCDLRDFLYNPHGFLMRLQSVLTLVD